MKTIELTDEMYNALMEISKNMNTQDHRRTQMPYFVQIQTEKEVSACEGCGNLVWVDCDGSFLYSEDDIKNAYMDTLIDEGVSETLAEIIVNLDWDNDECENWLEESGFKKSQYDTINVLENAFFTVKGCQDHIDKNKHHYNAPSTFITHAFRNPEMELVRRFLCELSEEGKHE